MNQAVPVCRYFAATGNCFYGDQCNFAHIRPNEVNNTYSTGPTPSTSNEIPESRGTGPKPKHQIPCRNIAVHGYCKFAGAGCEYNHDVPTKPAEPKSLNDTIASFQGLNIQPQTLPQQPLPTFFPPPQPHHHPNHNYNTFGTMVPPPSSFNMAVTSSAPPPVNMPSIPSIPNMPEQRPPQQVLQYNPTASALPNTAQPPPTQPQKASFGKMRLHSFFMNEDLRNLMTQRTHQILQTLDPEDPRAKSIPPSVHRYHSLFPLDDPQRPLTSAVFGFPTTIYKAISSADGLPYVIRKIEGFRLSNEQPLRMGERWKNIHHPGIVQLHEIFVSKDFGNTNSLYFAYHYFPGSDTLESRYFTSNIANAQLIPEDVLWSYIIQLVSAIKAVHSAGLACRVILPSKILITGKNRIRLSGVGIHDVVNFDGGKGLVQFQYEDLLSLGHLILCLACKSLGSLQNINKSIEFLGSRYSQDLKNLVVYLLSKPSVNFPSLDDIVQMLSSRMLQQIDALHDYNDNLESDLAKEYENGRLFRMLVKLGFINERPEFDMDPSWSETGDRYLLKLFRDYVFHQVYEDGSPVVDYAHVVECLNKLDAGVPEKIVLTSRDEQSILIVSYKDLKRCVMDAYNELMSKKPSPYRVAMTTGYTPQPQGQMHGHHHPKK
eukprot:CAMPEP_0168565566 /NCGR_PEP_ID=MMETSP0413-20121227/13917_1 /TAXON_ID=136452 /ORGANISM="Filamoeba nolandi, Strain NC-AS-23-1" /LENGTH=657 /DNA_ID=CAMNT_0008597453 /DNA_START=148 /DNA_END=2121 /DNA_ORIENTATION=-